MIYSRILILPTTAGICGYSFRNNRQNNILKIDFKSQNHLHIADYFYKSITNKYRINFIEDDNVQNLHQEIIAINLISQFEIEDDTPEDDKWFGARVPVVAVANTAQLLDCNANTARITAHPTIPSRSIIWYNDFCMYCDSRTRTKWWAHQVLTKGNVAQVEHRHCEAVTLDYNLPKVCTTDDRLDVKFVEPATYHEKNNQLICHHCQYSNIWKILHQYITFLTEIYDTVTVLSGVLFAPDENDGEDFNYCYTNFPTTEQTPTHFFKVIICKNDDNSCRLECYKIKNQPKTGELPELRNYNITREELEVDTGFLIHENIHNDQIRDQTTHPQFSRHSQHNADKGYLSEIADLGGYVWQNNIFKVKASFLDDHLSAVNLLARIHSNIPFADPSIEDNPLPENEFLDMLIRNSGVDVKESSYADNGYEYQLECFPGTNILVYDDFTIYLRDVPKRTSSWVIERITKSTVDHYEHRHFEVLKPFYKKENASLPFAIANLGGMVHAVLFPAPPTDESDSSPKYICRRCEVLSFRNVFHQYVKFLTERYSAVFVCSGNLVVPEPNEYGTCPEDVVGTNKVATHYFKIIVCKNNDDTYRFECYKIKPDPVYKKDIDLKTYLVTREQLNADAGIELIPLIKNKMILETATHPEFHSAGSSPVAHQVKHSCKDCSPFQDAPLPNL
uniref:ENPP1-3/EXOG-like endonuclease/phosphodiesterase domain-containing protein n=1 Tax=Strigamia maritima TaxID=126957 RepID=T1IR69_STRMM